VSPFAPTGIVVGGIATKIGLANVQWAVYVNNLGAHAAIAFAGYFLLGGRRLFGRSAAGARPRQMVAPALRGGTRDGEPGPLRGAGPTPGPLRGTGPTPGPLRGTLPTSMPDGVERAASAWPDSAPRPADGRYADLDGLAADLVADADAVLAADAAPGVAPFDWRHRVTIAVILLLVLAVIVFNVNVGLAALAGAMVLTIVRAADEPAAVRAMPWQVILMVSGITMLVAILEKTGGMALFTAFVARFTTPATVIPVAAFFTGVVSIYSSTTGVVLPALLPTIPGLIGHIGGGDPMALLSAMVVGGHLVDVSPLSTLGALCLAAAPHGTDSRALFNQLLAWGAAMSVIGALACWLLFGVL
jgi:hypothetical protein